MRCPYVEIEIELELELELMERGCGGEEFQNIKKILFSILRTFFEKTSVLDMYKDINILLKILFSQIGIFADFTMFDKRKITYIICPMVVLSTAGGNDEQSAREGNDGRVS